MKSVIKTAAASLIILTVVISISGCGRSVKKTIDEVPAAVRVTIENTIAGGEIKEIEQKQHKGEFIYEVKYLKDGNNNELKIAENGNIIKLEEITTLDKLPAAVKATIRKEANNGEITKIEKKQYGDKIYYKVKYVIDNNKKKIKIAGDGSLITSDKTDYYEDDETD
ncbi:MAG: hypothetical protein CVV49_06860 [Spirochaetae bacterium HGW-Spirochaetae-5]|nr:MAG: hypothetical protein CVV49_06860 [Spirochaetae bacterium HGW-Spirochaetae-5]